MDFDFEHWAHSNGLTTKTISILKSEDLDTKEVLLLADDYDLKDIYDKLTIGQNVILRYLLEQMRMCSSHNSMSTLVCQGCKRQTYGSSDDAPITPPRVTPVPDSSARTSPVSFYSLPFKLEDDFKTKLFENTSLYRTTNTDNTSLYRTTNTNLYSASSEQESDYASMILKKDSLVNQGNAGALVKKDQMEDAAIWQDMRNDMEVMLGIVHGFSWNNSGYINCKCCNEQIHISTVRQGIENFQRHIDSIEHRTNRAKYLDLDIPSELVAQAVLEILMRDFSNTLGENG